jgi:hypothetical protein
MSRRARDGFGEGKAEPTEAGQGRLAEGTEGQDAGGRAHMGSELPPNAVGIAQHVSRGAGHAGQRGQAGTGGAVEMVRGPEGSGQPGDKVPTREVELAQDGEARGGTEALAPQAEIRLRRPIEEFARPAAGMLVGEDPGCGTLVRGDGREDQSVARGRRALGGRRAMLALAEPAQRMGARGGPGPGTGGTRRVSRDLLPGPAEGFAFGLAPQQLPDRAGTDRFGRDVVPFLEAGGAGVAAPERGIADHLAGGARLSRGRPRGVLAGEAREPGGGDFGARRASPDAAVDGRRPPR